jgi:hypothetical protein
MSLEFLDGLAEFPAVMSQCLSCLCEEHFLVSAFALRWLQWAALLLIAGFQEPQPFQLPADRLRRVRLDSPEPKAILAALLL